MCIGKYAHLKDNGFYPSGQKTMILAFFAFSTKNARLKTCWHRIRIMFSIKAAYLLSDLFLSYYQTGPPSREVTPLISSPFHFKKGCPVVFPCYDNETLCKLSLYCINNHIRALNIFQVYQYFTSYRWYFLLKFVQLSWIPYTTLLKIGRYQRPFYTGKNVT